MEDLIAAARAGDLATVTRYADEGGDLNVRGARNTTALHHVISDYASDWTVCFTPAHEHVLRFLLAHKADVSLRSDDGWRALTVAAGFGNTTALGVLLEHGDSLDPATEDWKALLFAATWRQPETVRMLLRSGAHPDLRDPDGLTGLMRAVKKSHTPTVEVFLQAGADPNLATPDGWTALHFAATKANVESVQLLRAGGARIGMRTADKESAQQIAQRLNKSAVAEALRA